MEALRDGTYLVTWTKKDARNLLLNLSPAKLVLIF